MVKEFDAVLYASEILLFLIDNALYHQFADKEFGNVEFVRFPPNSIGSLHSMGLQVIPELKRQTVRK